MNVGVDPRETTVTPSLGEEDGLRLEMVSEHTIVAVVPVVEKKPKRVVEVPTTGDPTKIRSTSKTKKRWKKMCRKLKQKLWNPSLRTIP